MVKKRRRKGQPIKAFLAVSFVLGVLLGAVLTSIWLQNPAIELSPGEVYTRSITIVGVDKEGNGHLATLTVELRAGSGHIGFAVPPYESEDTQRTAVVARSAAESAAGYSFDGVDILISVEDLAPDTTLTGPSASAPISLLILATVRASENKAPNLVREDAVVSASINSIGRLEPVGQIEEKYLTVKEADNYSLFIVSKDQADHLADYPGISVGKAVDLNALAEMVLW